MAGLAGNPNLQIEQICTLRTAWSISDADFNSSFVTQEKDINNQIHRLGHE